MTPLRCGAIVVAGTYNAPFPLFFRLLFSQRVLTLRGVATSWFGVRWTAAESLHMRPHVYKISLKYFQCVQWNAAPYQSFWFFLSPNLNQDTVLSPEAVDTPCLLQLHMWYPDIVI